MKKSSIGIVAVIIILLIGFFLVIKISRNEPDSMPVNSESQTQAPDTAAISSDTQASSTANASSNSYTMAEVASHNTSADCWAVVSGKVYNITAFIPQHPGGKVIIQACGTDSTALFNRMQSRTIPNAQAVLNTYYIGTVAS